MSQGQWHMIVCGKKKRIYTGTVSCRDRHTDLRSIGFLGFSLWEREGVDALGCRFELFSVVIVCFALFLVTSFCCH